MQQYTLLMLQNNLQYIKKYDLKKKLFTSLFNYSAISLLLFEFVFSPPL